MQVFGLLGNPVEHSLSPPMHEAAYEAAGMDARYVTFEPSPDDLRDALAGARALGIRGLNVTIPFKRDVLEHVTPDDLAARIGAVNTIDFAGAAAGADAPDQGPDAPDPDADVPETGTDGEPTGHNTDAAGAVRALREHDVALEGRAVVVGAGGAGRAVAFGLADAGMRVAVANRTVERARDLASDLPEGSGHPLAELPSLLPGADVLVNATSVGMGAPDESPVPADALHGDLAVLDAVYDPVDTRLLRDARAADARTVDGAWMLLYQGAEAFERWTGRDAPVDAMNDALRRRL